MNSPCEGEGKVGVFQIGTEDVGKSGLKRVVKFLRGSLCSEYAPLLQGVRLV